MEQVTLAWTRRTAEVVLDFSSTKKGRRDYATRFVGKVFSAIAAGRCTSPKACLPLAIKTWRQVWEEK